MRNILNIAIFILSTGCFAQTINIIDKNGTRTTGAYYKDVDNLLNTFEGTYLYANGTDTLKIILIKKVNQYNGRYYEDLIIGEYQYIKNGIEKINTLSEINTSYSNQRIHNIAGNSLIKNTSRPVCNDCVVNEKRLRMGFTEPMCGLYGTMIVRKITQGGQEAIKIKTRMEGSATPYYEGSTPPPLDFTVPAGEYILIKG